MTDDAWRTADKAYQLHHFSCPQCIGAGITPGAMERCEAGAQLWAEYQRASLIRFPNTAPQRRPPPPQRFNSGNRR